MMLLRREYEWTDDGGIIRNYGPTIIYLIFKIIKPATRIDVSNLKDKNDKEILSKLGNNYSKYRINPQGLC